MFAHFIIFSFLTLVSKVACTLPKPGNSTNKPLNKTSDHDSVGQVDSETPCLSRVVNGHYILPWQETPQRAQGCSVPYNGPQGHGQHPEEVHIIHLLGVDKLRKALHNVQDDAIVPVVTVWLEAASWQSRIRSLWSSIPFKEQSILFKNESGNMKADLEIATKREVVSLFLNLEGVLPHTGQSVNHYKKDSIQILSDQRIPKTSRPLILLLTSDRPVKWRIKPGASWMMSLASKVQVVVERESFVDPFLPVEIIQKIWVKKVNRKTIQRFARRTFHGVASFTQIKGANTVRISVGPGGFVDQEHSHQVLWRNRNKLNFCDFSSRENSLSVSATWSKDLSVDSCIFGKGHGIKIVVIEVQFFSKRGEVMKGNIFNYSQADLPQVIILLSEVLNNEENDSLFRNVTIFLKSDINIQWILSSSVQHSFMNIVTQVGDIINCINGCGENFKFTSLQMPSPKTDFLRKVLTEFGSYIEFLTIKNITGFGLQVDHLPIELFTSNPGYIVSSNTPETPSSLSTATIDGKYRNIVNILESETVITCEKSTLEIVLPAVDLIHHGVKVLHFKDEVCQSLLNGTHFILATTLENCGSVIHSDGTSSISISNKIFVGFTHLSGTGMKHEDSHDFQDENKNEVGIPVACVLKPLLDENAVRSIFNIRGDLIAEEDKILENSSAESSSSIYQLELYYKSIQVDKLTALKYNNKIVLNDEIYVQVWMDDVPSARAVPESCWINTMPHSEKNMSLLIGMCPVGEGVKLVSQRSLHSSYKPKSFVFSFQISNDVLHLGHELYVHCQIGICLSKSKVSKDKSLLCMDPLEYCQHQEKLQSHSISTAHQLLSRGPIVVSAPQQSLKRDPPLCSDETVFPYSSTISMDMTAIIALCSFIIGMGLTATLWLIHNKTEPKQQACQREHSHGSQSAGLGSSLSPHSACSSTNSECAITS